MSPISFATAARNFSNRELRDVGIDFDGTVIDETDPRYRGIPQARMRLISRLMMRVGLWTMTMLGRTQDVSDAAAA